MRSIEIERTAYPQLKGDIIEREVIERYTLEPSELSLVKNYRGDQLSLAVRMKLFQHLLNHDFPLEDIPQKVVDYVASQLQTSSRSLFDIRNSKFEQTMLIRRYMEFSPFSADEQHKLGEWLIKEAEKKSHLVDLINEAIFHLMEIEVELPAFQHLVRLTSSALHEADRRQSALLNQNIPTELKDKLDALLQNECRYHRTPFYELKEPPKNPNANAIIAEVSFYSDSVPSERHSMR